MDDAELLKAVDHLKSTMISVATGGPRIAEAQDEFAALFDTVDAELRRRGIPNSFPYRELWDWYGRWSSGDLPSYKSRRTFVNELAGELVQAIKTGGPPAPAPMPPPQDQDAPSVEWDVFISHASEDKDTFVRPLAARLKQLGLKVWYDEFTLSLGDSLRQKIDEGLAHAKFGVVVISLPFLRKDWTQRELDGLVAREIEGLKVILPILHDISLAEVRKASPILASKLAANSSAGVDAVADQIFQVVSPEAQALGATSAPRGADVQEDGGLVLIGPDVIAIGDIDRIGPRQWRLHLRDFVVGDIGALILYAERFDSLPPHDRFVVLEELGDGRALTAAPEFEKDGASYRVTLAVAASAERISAQDMPSTMATSLETDDLFLDRGNIARVSGVASIPQRFREVLSHMRGESPFYVGFGSRLQEYFWRFNGSPRLGQVLKAEIVRLAAVPYTDPIQGKVSTQLHCVERVWGVTMTAEEPSGDRLPLKLDLDIKGLGRGVREISVLVPSAARVERAIRSGQDFFAGPARRLEFSDAAHQTDSARGAMFWGEDGKTRVLCIISREALEDHFSDGDRLSPEQAYLANREKIRRLASEKYGRGQIEPDGTVLLRTAELQADKDRP